MTHSNASASSLLVDNLPLLKSLRLDQELAAQGVLDLACGKGRNGLFLISHNVPVVFADNNGAALQYVAAQLDQIGQRGECWEVDFEADGSNPLDGKRYDAVLVFNYLHRPLMSSIQEAIRPGGLIIYETFTVQQRQFGRPTNPDFLLQPQELRETFSGWEILHDFEGVVSNPERSIARLIARRP